MLSVLLGSLGLSLSGKSSLFAGLRCSRENRRVPFGIRKARFEFWYCKVGCAFCGVRNELQVLNFVNVKVLEYAMMSGED